MESIRQISFDLPFLLLLFCAGTVRGILYREWNLLAQTLSFSFHRAIDTDCDYLLFRDLENNQLKDLPEGICIINRRVLKDVNDLSKRIMRSLLLLAALVKMLNRSLDMNTSLMLNNFIPPKKCDF